MLFINSFCSWTADREPHRRDFTRTKRSLLLVLGGRCVLAEPQLLLEGDLMAAGSLKYGDTRKYD